jgi:hypothetical protein
MVMLGVLFLYTLTMGVWVLRMWVDSTTKFVWGELVNSTHESIRTTHRAHTPIPYKAYS